MLDTTAKSETKQNKLQEDITQIVQGLEGLSELVDQLGRRLEPFFTPAPPTPEDPSKETVETTSDVRTSLTMVKEKVRRVTLMIRGIHNSLDM